MPAQTLNCPTCGAAISSDETTCRYCGSRLQTIACPNCFGMMFAGSKFCPHCGAQAVKPLEVGPALNCPDCKIVMKQILLKQTPLQECQRCFGIWVAADAFERICADRERQADVLSNEQQPRPHIIPAPVRYRPCPQCGNLMNRFNFGHTSGVIIDKCADHGVWFDRDELRRIVDYIQQGGLDLARQQDEWKETEKARETAAQQRVDNIADSFAMSDPNNLGEFLYQLGRAMGRRI